MEHEHDIFLCDRQSEFWGCEHKQRGENVHQLPYKSVLGVAVLEIMGVDNKILPRLGQMRMGSTGSGLSV